MVTHHSTAKVCLTLHALELARIGEPQLSHRIAQAESFLVCEIFGSLGEAIGQHLRLADAGAIVDGRIAMSLGNPLRGQIRGAAFGDLLGNE
jgi:hypothetical protein